VVDHDRPGSQVIDDTVGTEQDRLHLRRARDAQDHHLGVRREVRQRWDRMGAGRQQVVDRLVAGVLKEGERMAARGEGRGDAVTHDADADHPEPPIADAHPSPRS
jgi:hypothetical protein